MTEPTNPDTPELPASPPAPSTARPAAQPPRATSAQINALIVALDDPGHASYAYAEDELIRFGPQAVPFLVDLLSDQQSWLRAYRAAEALGQIGDGRASRPLIAALSHPNSNVRWGVVRALARVGDTRALLPLRRTARTDRAKTSWGESVASAAQVALSEMSGRSAMLRLSDPLKIALLVAIALFAFWFATSRVSAFRAAVDDPANTALWGTAVVPVLPTATIEPTLDPEADDLEATPTLDPAATPTSEVPAITATVTAPTGNIRPAPDTANDPIGQLKTGDVVAIIEQQGDWYRIALPDGTGSGWIAASIVGPPSGPVPTATAN